MNIKELAKQGMSFKEMLDLKNEGRDIEIGEAISDENFLEVVVNLQHEIMSAKTTKGLEKARSEGRVGGRPKIADELIESIRYMFNHQKLTLREIANRVDVSLGTAYKYTRDIEQEDENNG